MRLEAAAKSAELQAQMEFNKAEKDILEQRIKLKEQEMRVEQLEKNVALEKELAATQAKLKALSTLEEYADLYKERENILSDLPEDQEKVENYLASTIGYPPETAGEEQEVTPTTLPLHQSTPVSVTTRAAIATFSKATELPTSSGISTSVSGFQAQTPQ